VAARGARAAASDASHWVAHCRWAGRFRPSHGGVPQGLERSRLCRGPKRRNRISLGEQPRPEATRISLLINPNNPITVDAVTKDVSAAAAAIGRQIEVITAGSHREIDTAFAALVQKRADALLVMPDPLFMTRRVQLATLAARHTVPAIYLSVA
jgi:hypothetical protein